jgi:hypothetical protein
MRLLMGSKFINQALPLVNREAPLVQTVGENGKDSMESVVGPLMGGLKAKQGGVIKAVRKDGISIQYDDGTSSMIDMYNNFPYARKTYIRNTPQVKAGQRIKKGDLLATSNFTDDKGTMALGTNLRTAYLNYKGAVFEDAIVISESAAKKLTSEHMYKQSIEDSKELTVGKEKFKGLYPAKFSGAQLKTIQDDGVVKPGTVIKYGDPLFLAVKEQAPSPGTMGRRLRQDASVTWKHKFPAVVTDADKTKKGFKIHVRANVPMQVGDKLAGRVGDKGVISQIIKDDEMPRDTKGNPYEVLLSPLGVVSRTNSAQMVEAALGKVARKTGKPYVLPGFMDEDMGEYALKELAAHNLKDTDNAYDPTTRKQIKDVFAGERFFYKMQHTSEGKGKSRAVAHYTAEDQPARGGKTGAKHLGSMEQQSILSHGADKVLKDLKIVKGQKNSDFWRQLKLGQTPTMPGTPLVYQKFQDLIKASGVQLRSDKSGDHIFAMTNQQAADLTGNRQIQNNKTYGASSLKPIAGGLFDPDSTGSNSNGDRWSFIKLPEPLPNPVMADPLRSILGLKQKEFEGLVAGSHEIEGKTGPEALKGLLQSIDVKSEKKRAMDIIKGGAKSKRDAAVKKYQYHQGRCQVQARCRGEEVPVPGCHGEAWGKAHGLPHGPSPGTPAKIPSDHPSERHDDGSGPELHVPSPHGFYRGLQRCEGSPDSHAGRSPQGHVPELQGPDRCRGPRTGRSTAEERGRHPAVPPGERQPEALLCAAPRHRH